MPRRQTPSLNWTRISWAVSWVVLCALILFIVWYVIAIYLPALERQREAERLLQAEIEILKKHGLTELPTSTRK